MLCYPVPDDEQGGERVVTDGAELHCEAFGLSWQEVQVVYERPGRPLCEAAAGSRHRSLKSRTTTESLMSPRDPKP